MRAASKSRNRQMTAPIGHKIQSARFLANLATLFLKYSLQDTEQQRVKHNAPIPKPRPKKERAVLNNLQTKATGIVRSVLKNRSRANFRPRVEPISRSPKGSEQLKKPSEVIKSINISLFTDNYTIKLVKHLFLFKIFKIYLK
jgi:hypothetical protein